ncbi:class I SAM-dependent RNA methyltransferase [Thalassiella azotivora]
MRNERDERGRRSRPRPGRGTGPRRAQRPVGRHVGREVELDVGPVAHGGHCVARHEGRVVFVRHALPGERVVARLTEAGDDDRFWRADAVDVLTASPDRVPSAWPQAGPGGVGGGELAHVALPAQRRWKADVVREQLRRLAGLDLDVLVEAAPGDDARGGLAWRTRIELVADAEGRAGMHRHRSHEVLPLTSMPLATERVAGLDLFSRRWPARSRIEVVAPAGGDRPVVLVDGVPWVQGRPDGRPNARTSVREHVEVRGAGYGYRVSAAGFWQVHRAAPQVLAEAVLDALAGHDLAGAAVLDLYAGAGLLTQPLADLVGPAGRVVAVEGDATAVRDARRSLHDRPHVELVEGDVRRVLGSPSGGGGGDPHAGPLGGAFDAVVLDPPRVGAGRRVVAAVAGRRPRAVVYVACDPAALARDVAYLAEEGYVLSGLRAFDLFPMTHHVECVALLTKSGSDLR